MKTFPVVILVLLAFAAFFLTFLLAPLAVLMLFYVIYAFQSGQSGGKPKPKPEATPEHQQPWDAAQGERGAPDDEPAAAAPARRARITVVSRGDQIAAEQASAAPNGAAGEADADSATTSATPRGAT